MIYVVIHLYCHCNKTAVLFVCLSDRLSHVDCQNVLIREVVYTVRSPIILVFQCRIVH